MKKYYITIVKIEEGLSYNLIRRDNIDDVIAKELGGYSNLATGIISIPREKDDPSYIQSGITLDGKKAYSIICIAEEDK